MQLKHTVGGDVRLMGGALGAEVWGVDIAQLDDAGFADLHAKLLQHSVLAVHGQGHVSDEQLREFGLRWGQLDIHGYSPTVDGFEDVLRIHADAENPTVAEGWHSDVTWKTIPPKISMLLAQRVPSAGAFTLYASQYRAHEDLSDSMKALLEPLDGVHDGRNFDIQEINRPVNRPVVLTHPETGRKALYVNEGFTRAIDGLPRDESNAICKFVYAHCTKERYQARLRYEPGTLSIWDNRCVQHMAVPDFNGETRELHRVAVLCDAPPTR